MSAEQRAEAFDAFKSRVDTDAERRDNAVARANDRGQVIAELVSALKEMVRGYEADCACRNVAPDNVLMNHTWLALAYKSAVAAIKRGESA